MRIREPRTPSMIALVRLKRALILAAAAGAASVVLAADRSASVKATPYPLLVRQELTVVCIRCTPGEQPLHVENQFSPLSGEDEALLSKCLPTGIAKVASKGIFEDGPKAKAIFVLTGPFQHQVTVKQPWQSTVIYLQNGQTITVCPQDVALCDRRIYLEQQADAPRYTTYSIDLADGGRQGSSAGAW